MSAGSVAVVIGLWLTVTPGTGERELQLALSGIAALGAALSTRWPLAGAALAGTATAAAWLLGLTADPFLLASVGVFRYAEGRGARRFPVWFAAAGAILVCVMLFFGDAGNPTFAPRARGAFLGAVVLTTAWVLAVRTRQARDQSAARARADERLRLARDVHDVLAHSLGAIGVSAGVAAHLTALGEPDLRSTLHDVERQARDSLAELQDLLHRERDPARSPAAPPLHALLTELADTAERSGLRTTVSCPPEAEHLPAALRTTVHRIAQEAVTNAIRHAKATTLSIDVARTGTEVHLTVCDNGPGTARTAEHHSRPDHPRPGHGLTGMRERAELLGGQLTHTNTGQGFSVHARLPLAPAEDPT